MSWLDDAAQARAALENARAAAGEAAGALVEQFADEQDPAVVSSDDA